MIPKKIHYCWFGDKPLPLSAKKCIESWKKYFPDYEIIEWNEKNFDVNFNLYAKQAYDLKKFAFFTDVARLYIIYKYGGIYFDVDVEVIKKYDDVLNNDAFFGLESKGVVATGLGFGAVKRNWIIKEMLDDYNNREFIDSNNNQNLTPCPILNSLIFKRNSFKLNGNFEKIKGVAIYPAIYFNPKGSYGGTLNINDNTLSIHHYDGSWYTKESIKRAKVLNKVYKIFGKKFGIIIYSTIFLPFRVVSNIKERGIKNSFLKIYLKFKKS